MEQALRCPALARQILHATTRLMSLDKTDLAKLVRGALGEIQADLIVTGGKLINVYSGEILEGMELAVVDGRICYVGPSARHCRGRTTEIIDAAGCHLSPGFIDGHTHIGHYARPFENLQSFLPHGTTAVVASCDELSTVFGFRGLRMFLDEVERHPLRVYTLVSMVAPQDPLLCATAGFSDAEIAAALNDPRVLGMGEIVSWLRLLQCDDEILGRIALARQNRQMIHGHTAGARDQKLCAVAAAGISSCHEPIRFDEALERLRLGYWTMLREGSLRQDLQATLPSLISAGASLQRLILVTDSMTPDDVEERGHMDHVVRRAIELGLSPLQAIQAITINPAIYSGLEQEIGGIAPGRFADILLIDDLPNCRVREVLVAGKVVARDGMSRVREEPPEPPGDMMRSLRIGRAIDPATFKIPASRLAPKVRVMELVNQSITMESIVEMRTADGVVGANPVADILKVAMFDRRPDSPQMAFGFVKGLGVNVGAVGLTANLDENSLMVVGTDDADMAFCANMLLEAGGGIAVADKGQLLEMFAMPCGGIFSLDPWSKVGRQLRAVQARLRSLGSPFRAPMFPLIFLPFVTLPALRITARGLVRTKERKVVSLFVD